jgi:hypothetical protein
MFNPSFPWSSSNSPACWFPFYYSFHPSPSHVLARLFFYFL